MRRRRAHGHLTPAPAGGGAGRPRRGAALALATLGVLALAACGGGSGDPSSAAPGGTGPAEGTVTWWDTSDATNESATFRALIDRFSASHPKIKVNYVNVPFSEAQEKFRTAAQGDSGAPDVLRSEVAWTADFASQGYLADLTGAADTADFLPAPLSSSRLDGKLYGLPQVTDAPALLYNKAYFAKAGLRPPATWADVAASAAKLEAAVPQLQAPLFLQSGGYFSLPFIYGGGGDLLDVRSKRIVVNSAQAARGVQDAVDLVKAGAAKADTTSDSYNNMVKSFKDGTVAMIINGPWEVANILKGAQFKDPANLGIAPVPGGASGRSGTPVGGHNYVVYSKSKAPGAATEFVTYMSSAESQAFVAKELGLLPTRRSAYQRPEVTGNAVVTAFEPILEKSTARPWIPEGGSLFTALDQEYPKALAGRQTPQQALDNVAAAWKSGVVTDYTTG